MRVGPIAVLRTAGATYVTVVRNTPLVIVFAFFSFAAPTLGITFNWLDVHIGELDFTAFFGAAVVSLTLYTSTFVCEALRAGVNAVPLGQAEAARAIGLPFAGVMTQVVLPQAFRASVPPLASVQIALIKNTSVAGGVRRRRGDRADARACSNDFPTQRVGIFICFAAGYVVIVEVFSFLSSRLERRWRVARDERPASLFDAPGPAHRPARHRIYSRRRAGRACSACSPSSSWRLYDAGQFEGDKWEVFVTPDYVEVILVDGLLQHPEDGVQRDRRRRRCSASSSASASSPTTPSSGGRPGPSSSSSAPSRCCC